jgi:hypothetical protein
MEQIPVTPIYEYKPDFSRTCVLLPSYDDAAIASGACKIAGIIRLPFSPRRCFPPVRPMSQDDTQMMVHRMTCPLLSLYERYKTPMDFGASMHVGHCPSYVSLSSSGTGARQRRESSNGARGGRGAPRRDRVDPSSTPYPRDSGHRARSKTLLPFCLGANASRGHGWVGLIRPSSPITICCAAQTCRPNARE